MMVEKTVKTSSKATAATTKSTGTKVVKRQVPAKKRTQSKLSVQNPKIETSIANKTKSFEEIKKEISSSQRFLPIDRDTLKDKGFALTGAALKRYEFARKLDKTLPDLSVEKVQENRMRQVQTELDKAYKLVCDTLRNPGTPLPNSARSLPIPRSTRIHFPPGTGKKLGFTYEGNKPKEKILNIKFENIRPLLAPVNFTAPENPLRKALEQTLVYTRQESTPDPLQKGTPSPVAETVDATTDAGPDVNARIDQLLKKLEKGINLGEVYPAELDAKRQTSLYQTVGTQSGQALDCSPTDAVAYYDFYDLKLAWDPVWTDVDSKIDYTKSRLGMPPVLVDFDAKITLEVWNKYCQVLEELGGDSKEIEKRAARALIYTIFSKVVGKQTLPITDNGFTIDELVEISGWQEALILYTFYEVYTKGMEKTVLDYWIDNFNKQYIDQKDSIVRDISTVAQRAPEEATVYLGTSSTLGYPGKVFAPGSVNYGLLINYRQEWIPESWQVGELVQTLPLAPKESRRYTKKMMVSKKRSRKEIDNALSIQKADDSLSTRAESQIVQNAQESTSFDATAQGGVQVEVFGIGANAGGSTTFKTSAGNDSKEAKTKMREAVAKSAREFHSEHRVEVQIEESTSVEEYTESVISNPNEEITVTYLFYELQRRFSVTEALHNIRSVILVPNEVPHWSEIDWEWIKRYDWILKRSLLDDSFKPALDFVLEGQEALEIQLEALEERKEQLGALAESARKVVEGLESKANLSDKQMDMVSETFYATVGKDDGIIEDVFESIFGGDEGTRKEEYEKRVEGAQERLDRIEQKIKTRQEDLTLQRNALDRAIAEYNKGVLEKHSKVRQVERLIEHLRDNILYYMKAIWSLEPPDQRYLRLFECKVKFVETPEDQTDLMVRVRSESGTIDDLLPGDEFEVILPPLTAITSRKLGEIADIENLLGFKGNYMIFPLRIQSYTTAYMAQSFFGGVYDTGESEAGNSPATNIEHVVNGDRQIVGISQPMQTYAVDPGPSVPISPRLLTDAAAYIKSLKESIISKEIVVKLGDLLEKGLLSPESTYQRIIVPSDSLYIEALPGKYPILEDFKLRHRMIDAQKALAEYKSMELENIRAEARLRKLDLSDPEVDKLIRIEGGDADVSIDT